MKNFLLSLLLISISIDLCAQNIYSFGFDGTTEGMISSGWSVINQSNPTYASAKKWNIPTSVPTNYFTTGGQAGGTFSFATVNYQSTGTSATSGTGTISNWLISPVITVENGDVISFYTRTGRLAPFKADRLQLRMSSNGNFSIDPSLGATDLGDYAQLLVDINPTQSVSGYPNAWTQYSYTVVGLSEPTECKFAFRYFVANGGPSGIGSDQIGIDTFSVDSVLSINKFLASNYAVGPIPILDVINIRSKNNDVINSVEILDVNSRIVKNVTVNASISQFIVAELNEGVYFLKITSDKGVEISKIIKKK